MALLDRELLQNNLKSGLEALIGQVAGNYNDEIEESVSMVGFSSFEPYLQPREGLLFLGVFLEYL